MAFLEPCDNCAFRPASPEQRDAEGWRKLLTDLKAGGQFYCHKGVPYSLQGGNVKQFEYPLTPAGAIDHSKMRLCRGFLNAWGIWMKREFSPEEA